MAKLATLVDSFANDLSLWPSSYGGAAISARRAQIPEVSSTYAAITTATGWDLTSSSVFAQVTPLSQPGNGTKEVFMQIIASAGNRISFYQSGSSTLNMARYLGGVANTTTLAYDAVAHAWWRMTESGGTATWDTSPDGITWTQRRSFTHGLTLTNVTLDFTAGAYGAETSDNMYVNNVNVAPSGNFMAFM